MGNSSAGVCELVYWCLQTRIPVSANTYTGVVNLYTGVCELVYRCLETRIPVSSNSYTGVVKLYTGMRVYNFKTPVYEFADTGIRVHNTGIQVCRHWYTSSQHWYSCTQKKACRKLHFSDILPQPQHSVGPWLHPQIPRCILSQNSLKQNFEENLALFCYDP